MAREDHKYLALKNLIHNEYGIDREDIKIWVQDAVEGYIQREFKQYIDNTDLKNIINARIDNILNDALRDPKSHWGSGKEKTVREMLIEGVKDRLFDLFDVNVSVKTRKQP